jgi:AcrR family transcriptional regulator
VTPLRADAQRNLGLVLEAAAVVFRERGPEASIDEIAHRAGVGHATVLRHFGTKDDLMAAVVEQRIIELTELAERALAADDPGAAFADFVWQVADLHHRDRGLHDCLLRCAHEPGAEALQRLAARIVARAQKAGAVRRDVRPEDVPGLVRAALRTAPPGRWRPYVEVVLQGLRPAA